MQLTIENVTPAKTGKSLRVKANGEWYGAKKDSGIAAGMTIEAEVSDGDYGKWIDKWRALAAQQPPAQDKGGNGAVHNSNSGAPAWLPFASNTVAHAIQAGLITTPTQIEPWLNNVKSAYERATSGF